MINNIPEQDCEKIQNLLGLLNSRTCLVDNK